MYADVQDIRDAGISVDELSDQAAANSIAMATEYINLTTGMVFDTVPVLIRRACVLLAVRMFNPNIKRSADDAFARQVIAETTDGHSYQLENGRKGQTGDPEIDDILALYRRSMSIGSCGGGASMGLMDGGL